MNAVRQGDLAGTALLFERHHGALLRYFRRLCGHSQTSEDLTQETFWRILRYRNSFNSGKPFRAWMYQIARNLFYDHVKKNPRSEAFSEESARSRIENTSESEGDVAENVEKTEREQLLQKALALLPVEKRELIVLCRFEEMPQGEIAALLGCSVGAVKVRLCRALKELKEVYLKIGEERTV